MVERVLLVVVVEVLREVEGCGHIKYDTIVL